MALSSLSPGSIASPKQLIQNIFTLLIQPVITLLYVLSFLLFFWGVYEFIAGAESEDARKKGRNHMLWGVVGITVLLSINAIVNLAQNFFVK